MSEGILSFIDTWFCILEVMWFVKKITGGLMVRALLSGSSRPGQNPGKRQCVVLLGKTLYFHSASLKPGEKVGIEKFHAGKNPAMVEVSIVMF